MHVSGRCPFFERSAGGPIATIRCFANWLRGGSGGHHEARPGFSALSARDGRAARLPRMRKADDGGDARSKDRSAGLFDLQMSGLYEIGKVRARGLKGPSRFAGGFFFVRNPKGLSRLISTLADDPDEHKETRLYSVPVEPFDKALDDALFDPAKKSSGL
jgi:hypothetical protein